MFPSQSIIDFARRHGDQIEQLAKAVTVPSTSPIFDHANALLAIRAKEQRHAEHSITAELRRAHSLKEQA